MSRPDEISRRVLLLLRLDAQRLFERIKYRQTEYMRVFSQKRTREHFAEIFRNRYYDAGISDLKHCSEEVIIGLDQFYNRVDEVIWYLNHTEDMPATVQDNIRHHIHEVEECYNMLQLYINAEFGAPMERSADISNEDESMEAPAFDMDDDMGTSDDFSGN